MSDKREPELFSPAQARSIWKEMDNKAKGRHISITNISSKKICDYCLDPDDAIESDFDNNNGQDYFSGYWNKNKVSN